MEIPYTLCFCCYEQQVLLLYRSFSPNAQLWNGLGGKIEVGETPLTSVRREIREEAGIDLKEAPSLFFAGIVTWGLAGQDATKGMYVFIAHLARQQAENIPSCNTPEGLIAWKPLAWVCDPHNPAVVSNIPRFLPYMLEAQTPYEYFCDYEHSGFPTESFRQMVMRPLPAQFVLEAAS